MFFVSFFQWGRTRTYVPVLTYLPIHLPIYLPNCFFIYQFIYLSTPICPLLRLFIYPNLPLSIPIYLPLSIYLSTYPPMFPALKA